MIFGVDYKEMLTKGVEFT